MDKNDAGCVHIYCCMRLLTAESVSGLFISVSIFMQEKEFLKEEVTKQKLTIQRLEKKAQSTVASAGGEGKLNLTTVMDNNTSSCRRSPLRQSE